MVKQALNQSARNRAWEDTESFRQSAKSFWGFEVVGGTMLGTCGAYIGFRLTPEGATPEQVFAYPAIGGVVGVIGGLAIVFLLIYLWNLFRAPYKQRNEARNELLRHEGLLWIRAKGRRCLDERMGPIRKTLAWHFIVNITNPSIDKNLGIRSIVLRSKRDPKYSLKPTVGPVGVGIQGFRDKGLCGDIGLELFLEPSEPRAGTLVFVGESKVFMNNFINNWDNGGLFDDGDIVLIDNQGGEYSFPTDNEHITSL